MNFLKSKTLFLLLLFALAIAAPAFAAPLTYIGSWTVDQGPDWSSSPTAYTGQQAAALIFGGNPSDYTISIDRNTITGTNWISTYGGDPSCSDFPCGTVVADNFSVSTNGLYENLGDTSAYIRDWAVGSQYINYAFSGSVAATPEPSSLFLLGTGVTGLAGGLRRRFFRRA